MGVTSGIAFGLTALTGALELNCIPGDTAHALSSSAAQAMASVAPSV